MEKSICLLTCSNLAREVEAIKGQLDFADIKHESVDVHCNHTEADWQKLAETIARYKGSGSTIFIFGGHCLTRFDQNYERDQKVQIFRKVQCQEWVIDSFVLDNFSHDEKIVLLPGWVQNWTTNLKGQKLLDRKKAGAHFKNIGREIAVIDTGVYQNLSLPAADLGRFVKMPYSIFPVGVSLFAAYLNDILSRYKSATESEENRKRMWSIKQRITKLTLTKRFLNLVMPDYSEKDIISGAMDVFQDVLKPCLIYFYPLEIFSEKESVSDSSIKRFLLTNESLAWDDDSHSLLLRVKTDDETKGVIEIKRIPEEEKDIVYDIVLILEQLLKSGLLYRKAMQKVSDLQAEVRKAEKSLKESEQTAKSILDGIPVGLYRTTKEGRVIDANLSLARMLGFKDVESLKKKNVWDFHVDQSDRERWQALIETGSVVRDFEIQLRRNDGQIIWVKDTARAVKDKNGTVYYDGACEDITRKKQTDARLSWNENLQKSLGDVSKRLLSPTPLDKMSAIILEHAKLLTASSTCFIGYFDVKTERLIPGAVTPDVRSMLEDQSQNCRDFHGQSEIFQQVLKRKDALLINFLDHDLRFKRYPDWHIAVKDILAVPVVMDEKVVGVIIVSNSNRLYTSDDQTAVSSLAELYAIAIHRFRIEEELRALSLVDELTKLYNRRGFLTVARQQVKMANRHKKEMLLLYADLDDLKAINDQFGHQQGDEALIEAADVLRDTFRDSDIIARIGGDEFVVLVLDVIDNQPDIITRRLEDRLANLNANSGRKVILSLSFGLVSYDPLNPCTIEDLIESADRLMYEQKMAKKIQARL